MDAAQKRIDRAWQKSKAWITEFDGSATQTYLTNLDPDSLPQAFDALARQSQNFRVSIVSGEDGERAEFIRPESIPENIAVLQQGKIAGLNINYVTRLGEFDLDIHMVLNTLGRQKIDLELVWWSDQVFSEEADPYQRFSTLVNYFIGLQDLFRAPKLYLGPEAFERPSPGSTSWIEV